MTPTERLILFNQYEILKALYPDQTEQYDEDQEIIRSGYEQFYPELNGTIFEGVVPASVTREVIDILDMFRAIKNSSTRLKYTPTSHSATFEGFDGNDTTGHYHFAQFLRRRQGKWEELADAPDNSHSAGSLDKYRRMYGRWVAKGRKFDLKAADIEEIAG